MTPVLKMPPVSSCHVEGNRADLGLVFPPELRFFEGHFPGFPILPAVAQVHIAITYAAEYLGVSGVFAGMKNLKFRDPIGCGDRMQLQLVWDEPGATLSYAFVKSGDSISSGYIRFRR